MRRGPCSTSISACYGAPRLLALLLHKGSLILTLFSSVRVWSGLVDGRQVTTTSSARFSSGLTSVAIKVTRLS